MPKILVIIPAWNEEEAIGPTIAEVMAELPEVDLIVVDDGSTDRTVQVAESAGARVLSLPYNLGVGGAMRCGYTFAQLFGYDQAIQLDADGQHDPRNVRTVLAGLEHANISVGARFAGRGEYEVRGPRKWAMAMLAGIVSRLAKTKLTDITSGFRAADRLAIAQYVKHYPVEYRRHRRLVGRRHPVWSDRDPGAGRDASAARGHPVQQPLQGGDLPVPLNVRAVGCLDQASGQDHR